MNAEHGAPQTQADNVALSALSSDGVREARKSQCHSYSKSKILTIGGSYLGMFVG